MPFLSKNDNPLQKNADISNTKKALALKGIFSETTYVCVRTYQILSLDFRKGRGDNFTPLPTSKGTTKKPTQIRVKVIVMYLSEKKS